MARFSASTISLETTNHIFLGCEIARIIRRQSNWPFFSFFSNWPLNVEAFANLHICSWIKAIGNPSNS